jgi:dTDP-glucose 4,6-dehydratase
VKYLITGGAGFIGSHLSESLLNRGDQVVVLDNLSTGSTSNLADFHKNLKFQHGNILDKLGINRFVAESDYVVHLAAALGVFNIVNNPLESLKTNLQGSENVLELCDKYRKPVVIASTSEVYGTAQTIPIKESHSLNAQSPYAASKIAADQMAISFYRSYNLPVTILRPFNTFGPRQSARAILPTIISQLLNNKKLIKLGNLFPTRDFTYVDDTVAAFIATIKKNNIHGEVVNIGNKFEISIQDILTIMQKDFGFKFKATKDKKRIRGKKTEVERLFSSNEKAKTLLSWTPKYAGKKGFIKGLDKTISWFKKDNNLKYYNSDVYNI